MKPKLNCACWQCLVMSPSRWRQGVATRLLDALRLLLPPVGVVGAELSIYRTKDAAVEAYRSDVTGVHSRRLLAEATAWLVYGEHRDTGHDVTAEMFAATPTAPAPADPSGRRLRRPARRPGRRGGHQSGGANSTTTASRCRCAVTTRISRGGGTTAGSRSGEATSSAGAGPTDEPRAPVRAAERGDCAKAAAAGRPPRKGSSPATGRSNSSRRRRRRRNRTPETLVRGSW